MRSIHILFNNKKIIGVQTKNQERNKYSVKKIEIRFKHWKVLKTQLARLIPEKK